MLTAVIDFACRVSPGTKRFLLKMWFHYLARLDKEAHMIFMNYGYVDLNPGAKKIALCTEDEKDRYCIQLYHAVVGLIDFTDLHVLEVGCGRGGGASYMMRYLQPRSLVALDRCTTAVQFCRTHYAVKDLSFSQGDALALPFIDNIFDVVVNVESSHCYRSMERFLSEVVRVLRPDGYLLFADFRDKGKIDALRRQLHTCGLALLREEHINSNVVKALELDNERKMNLIDQKIPKQLRKLFHLFAGVQGTNMYEAFCNGDVQYYCFILRKRVASIEADLDIERLAIRTRAEIDT